MSRTAMDFVEGGITFYCVTLLKFFFGLFVTEYNLTFLTDTGRSGFRILSLLAASS